MEEGEILVCSEACTLQGEDVGGWVRVARAGLPAEPATEGKEEVGFVFLRSSLESGFLATPRIWGGNDSWIFVEAESRVVATLVQKGAGVQRWCPACGHVDAECWFPEEGSEAELCSCGAALPPVAEPLCVCCGAEVVQESFAGCSKRHLDFRVEKHDRGNRRRAGAGRTLNMRARDGDWSTQPLRGDRAQGKGGSRRWNDSLPLCSRT